MRRWKMIGILLVCLLAAAGGVTALLLVRHHAAGDGIPEEYRLNKVVASIRADGNGYGRFRAQADHMLYRIEVEGIAQIDGPAYFPEGRTTHYRVRLTYDYLADCAIDRPAIVTMRGAPSTPYLYEPRLLPGSSFIALSDIDEIKIDGSMMPELYNPYLFKLWAYEGETYLYPYSNLETGEFGEGVEFWFEEELPIYDPVRDADILAYLAGRGMEPPEFRHKYELRDFVEHVKQYRAQPN